MMLIGSNLRRLRQQKGWTQEQLAAVFGVSPQAVSRWENDTAYPDITMLPGMAEFYGITVDELLGVEQSLRQQELNRIHNEVHALIADKKTEQAAMLLRESLRRYPNNGGLLIELCSVLTASESAEAAKEAIVIGEQLLQNADISLKAKSTVAVTLVYLYLKVGDRERAVQKVSSLPHLWECRECVLPEISEDPNVLKETVIKTLAFLCDRIDNQCVKLPEYIQLGFSFDTECDSDVLLDNIRQFLKT